jgi:hypothetical protein
MLPYEFIDDHGKVLAHFGRWPSFHDGEVHRLVLDRTQRGPDGHFIPAVEIHLRGWIMTPQVTDAGFYKLEHDSVVHFRFEEVSDLELDGLNHQNVLSCLALELLYDSQTQSAGLQVELEHCYGLSGSFRAKRARVLSITPLSGAVDG